VATSLFLLAIITDILDGWLARKLSSVSAKGGLLDHSADAVLVAAILSTLSYLDLIPWTLPVFLMAAFVQYVLDSNALQGKTLRTSRLGRYNGFGYYILSGIPLIQTSTGWQLISESSIYYLAWGLVLTTVISMTDRAVLLWRSPS
jgi:cardiolipin synthase